MLAAFRVEVLKFSRLLNYCQGCKRFETDSPGTNENFKRSTRGFILVTGRVIAFHRVTHADLVSRNETLRSEISACGVILYQACTVQYRVHSKLRTRSALGP